MLLLHITTDNHPSTWIRLKTEQDSECKANTQISQPLIQWDEHSFLSPQVNSWNLLVPCKPLILSKISLERRQAELYRN